MRFLYQTFSEINFETKKEVNEEDFINQEFDETSIYDLNLDEFISDILNLVLVR